MEAKEIIERIKIADSCSDWKEVSALWGVAQRLDAQLEWYHQVYKPSRREKHGRDLRPVFVERVEGNRQHFSLTVEVHKSTDRILIQALFRCATIGSEQDKLDVEKRTNRILREVKINRFDSVDRIAKVRGKLKDGLSG
tara:strand:- start:349 stop:765 length:417 start_codon:yes stop_codon:yes gene_type:complete